MILEFIVNWSFDCGNDKLETIDYDDEANKSGLPQRYRKHPERPAKYKNLACLIYICVQKGGSMVILLREQVI